MRNCLVLGSGRSGTSMVAGMLHRASYTTGDDYIDPRLSNPKGFYEDRTVNKVNDELLFDCRPTHGHRWILRRGFFPWRYQLKVPGWWAHRPVEERIGMGWSQSQILGLVSRQPFAYKDPRFAFTLPVWRPHLPDDTGFVVVFRHPAVTADSMLRERDEMEWLQQFPFDRDEALRVWTDTYEAILDESAQGKWLFLHFDQVLSGEGVERLGRFLGADVDGSFADRSLSRAKHRGSVPDTISDIYSRLCAAAEFTERIT